MSSPDALRAALALAALNEQDRDWILAQLGEPARQLLYSVQAQLEGEDLAVLAAGCDSSQVDAEGGKQPETDLLAVTDQIMNLLKHEPVWVRTSVLACFSTEERRRLQAENISPDQTEYPALPPALKTAVLSSLRAAIERNGE